MEPMGPDHGWPFRVITPPDGIRPDSLTAAELRRVPTATNYDRDRSKSPFQNPLIFFMGPYPKPIQIIATASGQGAITAIDGDRPAGADFLEAQGRVIGVRLKERVLLVSPFLNVPRQRVVTLPELR